LQILGIKPQQNMDGRILSEGMTGRVGALHRPDAAARRPNQTSTIDATKNFPSGTWRQSLKISRVGSTIYLDEGNGAFIANKPAANELKSDR
jgi:hypothetical protein